MDWRKTGLFLTVLAALFWFAGCPADDDDDDDDVADDDTGDDDTGDDDTGDDDTADDDTGDDDTGEDTVRATVSVPGEFDAVPVRLIVVYQVDLDEGTTPIATGYDVAAPEIGVGTPIDVVASQAGLEGDHYPIVVLYVEGGTGGNGPPTPGVDWIWISMTPHEFGAGTIDLGDIELFLFEQGP